MDAYLMIADAIKDKVSAILRNALSGYELKYRTKTGYIKWGAVEKDMHRVIEEQLTGDEA